MANPTDELDLDAHRCACAHKHIVNIIDRHPGGLCSEHWECRDCKTHFRPYFPPDDAPSPAENGGDVAELLTSLDKWLGHSLPFLWLTRAQVEVAAKALREAAGVREQLENAVTEAESRANDMASALSTERKRAESAEKRLADVEALLRVECSNIAALGRSHDAERERRLAAEKRLAEAEALIGEYVELVSEYECQWGDDYLAKKWGLPERAAALKTRRIPTGGAEGGK